MEQFFNKYKRVIWVVAITPLALIINTLGPSGMSPLPGAIALTIQATAFIIYLYGVIKY